MRCPQIAGRELGPCQQQFGIAPAGDASACAGVGDREVRGRHRLGEHSGVQQCFGPIGFHDRHRPKRLAGGNILVAGQIKVRERTEGSTGAPVQDAEIGDDAGGDHRLIEPLGEAPRLHQIRFGCRQVSELQIDQRPVDEQPQSAQFVAALAKGGIGQVCVLQCFHESSGVAQDERPLGVDPAERCAARRVLRLVELVERLAEFARLREYGSRTDPDADQAIVVTQGRSGAECLTHRLGRSMHVSELVQRAPDRSPHLEHQRRLVCRRSGEEPSLHDGLLGVGLHEVVQTLVHGFHGRPVAGRHVGRGICRHVSCSLVFGSEN